MSKEFDDFPNSAEEARKCGAKRYFTGKPCSRGHISPKNTCNNSCVECSRLRAAKRRKENPEYNNNYYYENRESILASGRKYYRNNKEREKKRTLKWREENREHVRKMEADRFQRTKNQTFDRRKENYINWLEDNREHKAKKDKEWRLENKDRISENEREWRRNNKGKVNEKVARRRAVKKCATPQWADISAIKAIYEHVKFMDFLCGIEHDVDHIIPLNGKLVCGLHVPDNLQILPRHVNRAKGNKVIEDWKKWQKSL